MDRIKYAVIRYQPDEVKQEVFNIVVVVHVPEQREVVLHMAESDDTRLHYNLSDGQLYTYKKFSSKMRQYVKGITGKMLDDKTGKSLSDDEFLRSLSVNMGHGFRIERIQSGVTTDITLFSERIFNLHVTQGKPREPDVVQLLFRKFIEMGLDKMVQKNVPIRGIDLDVKAAFSYMNGASHYIQPITVQRNARENIREGGLWTEVIKEVRESDQDSVFHFIIRRNQQYDQKSYAHLCEMLTRRNNDEVLDFEDIARFVGQVQSDLKEHPLF